MVLPTPCRYVNHNLYWAVMCINGEKEPPEPLLGEIMKTFGTFKGFREHFTYAALSVFGSGYVWLVEDDVGNLQIVKIKNQVHFLISAGPYPRNYPNCIILACALAICLYCHGGVVNIKTFSQCVCCYGDVVEIETVSQRLCCHGDVVKVNPIWKHVGMNFKASDCQLTRILPQC